MNTLAKIKTLLRGLLPTGRAWQGPLIGWMQTLINATATVCQRAYDDAVAIHFSILPDNDNFTVQDATDWERRLGMVPSSATLADRKLAIARKMNHPGTIPARQHHLYIQGQLQAAGFDVFVYENLLQQNPVTVFGGSGLLDNQHGQYQHGQLNHGGKWNDIIANHIDLDRDRTFNVGANLRATFFICGGLLGDPAYVPAVRRDEFRQLILNLKPVQNVGFLFVIYT